MAETENIALLLGLEQVDCFLPRFLAPANSVPLAKYIFNQGPLSDLFLLLPLLLY